MSPALRVVHPPSRRRGDQGAPAGPPRPGRSPLARDRAPQVTGGSASLRPRVLLGHCRRAAARQGLRAPARRPRACAVRGVSAAHGLRQVPRRPRRGLRTRLLALRRRAGSRRSARRARRGGRPAGRRSARRAARRPGGRSSAARRARPARAPRARLRARPARASHRRRRRASRPAIRELKRKVSAKKIYRSIYQDHDMQLGKGLCHRRILLCLKFLLICPFFLLILYNTSSPQHQLFFLSMGEMERLRIFSHLSYHEFDFFPDLFQVYPCLKFVLM